VGGNEPRPNQPSGTYSAGSAVFTDPESAQYQKLVEGFAGHQPAPGRTRRILSTILIPDR
jgi:hypothetical protein